MMVLDEFIETDFFFMKTVERSVMIIIEGMLILFRINKAVSLSKLQLSYRKSCA